MDTAQLAQMVTWLDEEHRRDRAEISRLQQQLRAKPETLSNRPVGFRNWKGA